DTRRNRKSIPCSLREGIVRVSSLGEFLLRFPAFLPSSSQSQLVNGISLPPCPSGIVGFSKNWVQARSTLIAPSRTISSSISFMVPDVVLECVDEDYLSSRFSVVDSTGSLGCWEDRRASSSSGLARTRL